MAMALFAVVKGFEWFLAFPFLVLLTGLGIFYLDKLFFILVFLVPLSVNFAKTSFGIGVSVPAEPITFGLMVIFLLKMIHEGNYDSKILRHPVSVVIVLHLLWMIITSINSSMPLVSMKYTLARICFVTVFYFMAAMLFRYVKNIHRFVWFYLAGLVPVIFYATVNHMQNSLSERAAHYSMTPFYNDHTAYGAVIALFIPAVIFSYLSRKEKKLPFFHTVVFLILIAALVLSYSRASWIGMMAAIAVMIIFLLRIKFALVFAGIISVTAFYFIYRADITIALERNDIQSDSDLQAHFQSISNIKTDASNVERLNRWASALRMFEQKPLLGWGPGTYQFKYAPFQMSREKTIISTNRGDRGNAHSEYIGPLVEQGIFGTGFFILVIVTVMYHSITMMSKTRSREVRLLTLGLLLGLVTYWVHGFLNNFLDTDKASAPFWAFIAALTALQVYHSDVKRREIF